MNRLIICTILLLSSQAVLAEKLYRWIEPDGSITFSPNPPAEGVDYKAVDSSVGGAGLAQKAPAQTPSILATSEHDVSPSLPPAVKPAAAPAVAAATPGLTYAPEVGSRKQTTTVAQLAQPEAVQQTQTTAVCLLYTSPSPRD